VELEAMEEISEAEEVELENRRDNRARQGNHNRIHIIQNIVDDDTEIQSVSSIFSKVDSNIEFQRKLSDSWGDDYIRKLFTLFFNIKFGRTNTEDRQSTVSRMIRMLPDFKYDTIKMKKVLKKGKNWPERYLVPLANLLSVRANCVRAELIDRIVSFFERSSSSSILVVSDFADNHTPKKQKL